MVSSEIYRLVISLFEVFRMTDHTKHLREDLGCPGLGDCIGMFLARRF